MSNQKNIILSLLKDIDKNIENIGIGVDPNDTIPLEIPPKDSVYYRTYVNDAVYWDLGSGSSGTSGDSGIDILNQWINGSGTVTINDLKEVLGNSPSAQVGVINELITEIALPNDITYLPYISPNLKKVYANNIEDVNTQNKQTLLVQLSEDGPLKCGKVLFGWKGEIPEVITADITKDITTISEECFADSNVSVVELSDSVEKVGRKAFNTTPFLTNNFTEEPLVYFGKTFYGLNASFDKIDEIHIPEGIQYVWLDTLDDSSAECGLVYLPSSLKEISVPFVLVDNIVFPKELPPHYDYNSTGSGTLLGTVYTIMYNGTIADFEELLSIVGTDWLNKSSLKIIICTDGMYPITNNLIYYTTVDGSEVEDSANGVYYGTSDYIFDGNSSVKTIKVCGDNNDYLLYICNCNSLEVIDLSEYTRYQTPSIYSNPALTTLILPDTITEFAAPGPYFLEGCPLLTTITYNGTQELWESIYKWADDWYTHTNVKQVICSDGIIEIQ